MKLFIIPHPTKNFNPLYTCPRGEAIVKQGLAAHPEVELVDSPDKADYYILDYVPHANGEKWDTSDIEQYYGYKLIVIDWVDEHDKYLVDASQCFLYFKRSWCAPNIKVGENAICNKYDHRYIPGYLQDQLFPISYAILDEFPRNFTPFAEREIDLGCYLRWTCPNRNTVKWQLIHGEQSSRYGDTRCHFDEVSGGSRSVGSNVYVDDTYFEYLGNTKINVTCNPTWWIGDSRLFESLASGCLTICDFMDIPNLVLPDVVFYDMGDPVYFHRIIKRYLSNLKLAEEIARAGQEHALKYHTSVARMGEVVEMIKWRREYDKAVL